MPVNKLTDEQEADKTPVERFRLWMELNPGELQSLQKSLKLPPDVMKKKIAALESWLEKYQHSPRSQKRDWARFLKNNLPNYSRGNYGTRESISRFNRPAGKRKME